MEITSGWECRQAALLCRHEHIPHDAVGDWGPACRSSSRKPHGYTRWQARSRGSGFKLHSKRTAGKKKKLLCSPPMSDTRPPTPQDLLNFAGIWHPHGESTASPKTSPPSTSTATFSVSQEKPPTAITHLKEQIGYPQKKFACLFPALFLLVHIG